MIPVTGISIVIRTSNSEKPLRKLLNSFKTSPEDEIVIVDTGSTDGTIHVAEAAGAKIIQNTRTFNYSHTLNLGFDAAKNNWILSLSAHSIPVNVDFLERYRLALARLPETTVVVYGLQAFSRRDYNKLTKEIVVFSGPVSPKPWCGGGNTNALYWRKAWESHRFDESIQRGEDGEWRDWALKTGYACAQAAEACMFYRHNKGPIYRYKKAYADVTLCMQDAPSMSFRQLMIGFASATRHLLWENFYGIAWTGEVAHLLGSFAAGRRKKIDKERA